MTWKETTQHERNLKIYREEFENFLPDKILDFHVHVFNERVIPANEFYSCGGHPIKQYDLNELKQDLTEIYPGRTTSAVCFGFPHVNFDTQRNNDYLAQECDSKQFFPFRLLDPITDKPDSLRKELIHGRFWGIKPYPDFVRKANINDVEIHEMLPAWAMEIVNELGLIVMLHIPRKARLADPLNQKQIVELCTRHPKAKIVLAHIGRAYYLKNVFGNLENLKNIPNVYFDLAMLNHWEVLEYLFHTVSVDKILFGTDIPISLAPGKSVEINDQYTYVTPIPWELSISDEHNKLVFTSFLYEELRAIKKAVQRLGLKQDFCEQLFYGSGMKLLNTVRAMVGS